MKKVYKHIFVIFIIIIVMVTTGCSIELGNLIDESQSIAKFNKKLYLKSIEPYENKTEFESRTIKETNGVIDCVYFCNETQKIYFAEKGSNKLNYIFTEDNSEKTVLLENRYQEFNILNYAEYLIVVCDGDNIYCISKDTDEIIYHYKS